LVLVVLLICGLSVAAFLVLGAFFFAKYAEQCDGAMQFLHSDAEELAQGPLMRPVRHACDIDPLFAARDRMAPCHGRNSCRGTRTCVRRNLG
jgi:hypothetical protein